MLFRVRGCASSVVSVCSTNGRPFSPDATSAQRVAMHKLHEECEKRGLALSWPAAICRSKFKCALDEATATQLWQLVFSVRNSKHPLIKKPAATDAAGKIDIPF